MRVAKARCSTPEGDTDFDTSPLRMMERAGEGAQRPKATLISTPFFTSIDSFKIMCSTPEGDTDFDTFDPTLPRGSVMPCSTPEGDTDFDTRKRNQEQQEH